MRPTTQTLRDPSHLEILGEGCYATAYLQRDGTVLKISSDTDGSMDYIEWCFLRMRKFGKGSPEMAGLPEVEHFGRGASGWWAVMPRYQSVYAMPYGSCSEALRAVDHIKDFLEMTFGRWPNDVHGGNVMWDPKRRLWVITDPYADDATGTAPSIPQKPRFGKPKATWKRSPLQCVRPR